MADDYKTTIKIEADTTDAEAGAKREATALGALAKSIDAIRGAAAAAWQSIARLIEALGERLTSLVSQVKELNASAAASPVADAARDAATATENLAEKQKALNAALEAQKPGADVASATENLAEKQKALNAALEAQKPVTEIAEAAREAAEATDAAAAAQGRLNAALAGQKPGGDVAKAEREAEEAVKRLTTRQQELNAALKEASLLNEQQRKSALQNLTEVADAVNPERTVGALARIGKGWDSLIGTLQSARAAVQSVMRAFGLFYLAFEGVKTAYENISKLVELWKEYKAEAERAALASRILDSQIATNRLAEAQKNLNAQLEKQLSLLQRAASLREMRDAGSKSFADEQRNVDRAVELAGVVDPRQRRLIEDRYAREDEARSREERSGDVAARIGRLQAEADAYDASAAKATDVIEGTWRAGAAESKTLRTQLENKASDEEREATMKRIAALEETRAAAAKEKKTYEEEAAYRRAQIQILEEQQKEFERLGTSAATVQAAEWQRMDAADARANEELAGKLEKNEAADKWARDFAKATPTEKTFMLQDKENEARGRLEGLRGELDAEMGKAVADRDQDRMAKIRSDMEGAQGEMFSARRQREGIEKEIETQSGARNAVDLGAGSRLNAMGLGAGSGVARVQEQMATSLRDLVRLGRDQLAALKDIRDDDGGATFQ